MNLALSTIQNWKINFFGIMIEEKICMLPFKEYRNLDINTGSAVKSGSVVS